MDVSKYPLEKLSFYVAGVIPGSVALLIFEVASPGSLRWFFWSGFLGYRTKLAVALVVAFLIGNSMSTFLYRFLGAIRGSIGGYRGYTPPHAYEVAPWRDPAWRSALGRYLGPAAPADTRPMTPAFVEWRRQQIAQLPEDQRPIAEVQLNGDRLRFERDDIEWARWYDQYHLTVLQPADPFVFGVERGLSFNLQTSALYTLVAAAFVPAVRHWWCMLPAVVWTTLLVLEEAVGFQQVTNRWLTLDRQITYLSGLARRVPTLPTAGT